MIPGLPPLDLNPNGKDVIYGLGGNDTLYGGNATDAIFGGSGDDSIGGGSATDSLYGGSGNDVIRGDDEADNIYGGYGADTLSGNAGADAFIYRSTSDTGDTIEDFSVADGDKINLSAIDANGAAAGDQAFTFFNDGNALTTDDLKTPVANGVWYSASGGTTTIYVDTNGSVGSAEMVIYLNGELTLAASDFIL